MNRSRWMAACLACVVAMSGCPSDPTDDPESNSSPDASTGNTGMDAGAVACPAVAGVYAWDVNPSEQCPSDPLTPSQRSTNLEQPGGGCTVNVTSNDTDNHWALGGSFTMRSDGSFTDQALTMEGTALVCSGVFTDGAPGRFAVTCNGGCMFTLADGE